MVSGSKQQSPSPILFDIFLERFIADSLEDHIGSRNLTNLPFADDIVGLAGSEQKLKQLVERLDQTSSEFGMKINAEKTEVITNCLKGSTNISHSRVDLEQVQHFKYLGVIVSDQCSNHGEVSGITRTTAAMTKFRTL